MIMALHQITSEPFFVPFTLKGRSIGVYVSPLFLLIVSRCVADDDQAHNLAIANAKVVRHEVLLLVIFSFSLALIHVERYEESIAYPVRGESRGDSWIDSPVHGECILLSMNDTRTHGEYLYL